MVVDPELLEKAKTAGAELADAERQVLLTRAEYHSAGCTSPVGRSARSPTRCR